MPTSTTTAAVEPPTEPAEEIPPAGEAEVPVEDPAAAGEGGAGGAGGADGAAAPAEGEPPAN